jgi:RNA polymerase sigma-70 factor (ECF subfamily)
MLGSVVDADDAVQETMLRAWRSLDRFEGRSSVKTWLYRIATNACLDIISGRPVRIRPMESGEEGTVDDPLIEHPRTHWLEPIPDAHVIAPDAGPEQRAIERQNIRLAFVAALQHLPPKQRAVLLLTEVLGWSAAEVAETLETTVASVNSALQRARATLASRKVDRQMSLAEAEQQLLDRYVEAFHSYDVDALTSLLREDATFSMPPYSLWLRGPQPGREWLLGHGIGCRGSRLIPTQACGLPAFGQYRCAEGGGHAPWALIVLETDGKRITGWNSFLDTATLFPRFGLPMSLPADDAR